MLKGLSPSVLAQLIEESTDAVVITDEQMRVLYVNSAMERLSGYQAGELLGESFNGLLPGNVATKHDGYVTNYYSATRSSSILGRVREFAIRHRTGELIPVELKAMDLGWEAGKHYLGAFLVDLRRRKEIEARNAALLAQLEQQALTDPLTGLPNRRAFELEATRALANSTRSGLPTSVGIADIDRFKKVNDEYGHAAGDIVLREAARIVQRTLRKGDLFGRWGGEEFCLLLPNARVQQATAVVERFRNELQNAQIFVGNRSTLNVTISVGLTILHDADTLDTALARADAALYQAKLTGRNRIVVSEASPGKEVSVRSGD